MSTTITVYRTPLSSPQLFTLLPGGRHPREEEGKEHRCLQRVLDDAEHETRFVRWTPGGEVQYRKVVRWEGGRRTGEEEHFAETGATVTHEIVRGGDAETERVLFDGELDSTIERTFHPDGTLATERVSDASGEETGLTEHDGAGRVVYLVDPSAEQRLAYDPAGAVARVATTVDGEETVEETVFEGGVPVGAVITRSGGQIGRRTIAREGRRRIEEETRDGQVVLRRVETLDEADRVVGFEETAARADGGLLETRREQLWSAGGPLLRATAEAWLTVPGAGRMQAGSSRREMSYDDAGRVVEMLLEGSQQEDFEGDSYYRFEYSQKG